MADAPRRAYAGSRGGHGPHQLVGMQAAFHQELTLAFANELNASCGGRITVGDIHNLELADVDIVIARDRADLLLRPDQDGIYDSDIGRLRSATKRSLVAGMHHNGLR